LTFDAKARIAGISGLSVTQSTPRTTKVGRGIPWTVYPVGVFSALLLLVAMKNTIPGSVRQHKMKQSIKGSPFAIPKNGTPETYLAFVNTELSFVTHAERGALVGMIKSFPAGAPLDRSQQKLVEETFLATVRPATSNFVVAILLLAISLGGLWYILARIW
jgi:hypothetical protein